MRDDSTTLTRGVSGDDEVDKVAEVDDSLLDESYRDPHDEVLISEFLTYLSVCHTVQLGSSGVSPSSSVANLNNNKKHSGSKSGLLSVVTGKADRRSNHSSVTDITDSGYTDNNTASKRQYTGGRLDHGGST